jgi:hypothetical protein
MYMYMYTHNIVQNNSYNIGEPVISDSTRNTINSNRGLQNVKQTYEIRNLSTYVYTVLIESVWKG